MSVRWDQPLQRAQKFPLTLEVFPRAVWPFRRYAVGELASVEVEELGPVMVPKSVLNI